MNQNNENKDALMTCGGQTGLSGAALHLKRIGVILMLFLAFTSLQAISPYLLVGDVEGDLTSVESQIEAALTSGGFNIIGTYNPSNNKDKRVLVYSSANLKNLCGTVEESGMLAAALKIGFWNHKGKIRVTMLNPEYLFYVYLREKMENKQLKESLLKINTNAIEALSGVATTMKPFGGDIEKKKLKGYKYMVGMPKFEDQIVLQEYSNFQQGVNTIQSNLNKGKGSAIRVFEIIDEKREVAVFGIGLQDPEKGEGHFLPIIGEKHIAGMPYEIILQGNKASMLHGRFRFASHWPELTMGTFTKIMSSPGDVEAFMKALSE